MAVAGAGRALPGGVPLRPGDRLVELPGRIELAPHGR